MDREKLKRELREQFEHAMDRAMEAVDRAPDGQWIAASEWQVREAFQRLMAESFQRMVQARLDATNQVAFSPSGPGPVQQGAARGGRAERRR